MFGKAIKGFLRLLFMVSTLIFLVSVVVPYISPSLSGYIALPGFLFPWMFLIQLFWIFIWLYVQRRMAIAALLVVLAGSYNAVNYVSVVPHFDLNNANGQLKLMTWNVKNFDLYNWQHNTKTKEQMMDIIHQQKPDVLVLQEFYTDKTASYNTLGELVKIYPYYQFRKTLVLNNSKYWGVATFSKYPLANKQFIRFNNTRHNQALVTSLIVDHDTLSIYNVHLQSIHFDEEDYEGLETAQHGDFSNLSTGDMIRKLAAASQKRAHQADTLQQFIAGDQHPVILCGDFNDSPNSYAYYTLRRGLNDAFLKAGWGIGQTYDGPIPALRIDFVLTSPTIQTTDFKVIKTNSLSDHYPVVATFALP